MSEMESFRYHLDVVAGSQVALATALKLLLSSYQGNAQATVSLQQELERAKADILASRASDYKIKAFDEVATSLLDILRSKPK